MTEEIKNNSNKLVVSLILHLVIGALVLWGVFLTSAFVNKLPITPKTLAPPTLVGLISGYLVYRSKKKIIEANMNLENIVNQRTLDLKVANDMLQDSVKELADLKKEKEAMAAQKPVAAPKAAKAKSPAKKKKK